MKRILIVVLMVLVLALGITGCARTTSTTPASAPTPHIEASHPSFPLESHYELAYHSPGLRGTNAHLQFVE